jgi:CubicO group peptidase (beta-lactamase class C family)
LTLKANFNIEWSFSFVYNIIVNGGLMLNKYIRCLLILILGILLLLNGCSLGEKLGGAVPAESRSGSSADWKLSTPEEQGMDSAYIAKMLNEIQRDQNGIHSVLIVKNGYLVTEAYMDPFDKNTLHDLFSASKSITSATVGIALDEKHISINQNVVDIFPDLKIDNPSENKSSMTIKDLLTMSTGHRADTTANVIASGDWTQTFLDLDVPQKPGTEFVYNSGATYMLSAIIRKVTGENTLDYACKKIFEPLGITDAQWEASPDGTSSGGWGLYMTPRDMAVFGYLYLNEGAWQGKQLIPREWIKESTRKQIGTGPGGSGYGYQWWLNPFGGYRADGYGGQYIFVMPKLDMVAVFTAGLNFTGKYPPMELMSKFIIPAVKADKAIKPNPKANDELQGLISELGNPKSKKVTLPEYTRNISGKSYEIDANNYGIQSINISFDTKKVCKMTLVQNGVQHELNVGTDGAYIRNKAQNLGTFVLYPGYTEIGLKGYWEGSKKFVLDWQYIGEPYKEKYDIEFNDSGLKIQITEDVKDVSGMVPQSGVLYGRSK